MAVIEKPPPVQITMTVREFAKAAGVTKNTVFDWVKRGEVRSIKIGGLRLIDVEAYRNRLRNQPISTQSNISTEGGIDGGTTPKT